ncbi:hypothetical protein Tco_0623406 [Tanacetum coccineum]
MIFKVDFEKAFDTLNWNFLDDIMRQMGFEFKVGKGVHQGDPLSHFLFLIMAEALSVVIKEATVGAKIEYISWGRLDGSQINWSPIIEKVQKRFSLWQAWCLSIGGRLTLVKSVLAEDQKISWVAWKQIMADRSMRGLGIGSLSASNLGLLATCGLDHKALIRFIQGCLL